MLGRWACIYIILYYIISYYIISYYIISYYIILNYIIYYIHIYKYILYTYTKNDSNGGGHPSMLFQWFCHMALNMGPAPFYGHLTIGKMVYLQNEATQFSDKLISTYWYTIYHHLPVV